jgi:hypothetical protein
LQTFHGVLRSAASAAGIYCFQPQWRADYSSSTSASQISGLRLTGTFLTALAEGKKVSVAAECRASQGPHSSGILAEPQK